jgi:hypothetical protein
VRLTLVLSGSSLGVLLLPALLADAPSAAAQPSNSAPDVRIQSTTCPHPLVEETERLTRVELNNTGLPSGADAPRVILSCAERVILIRATISEHEGTRQLDLDQTDSALRARVVALAIAELVRDTAGGDVPVPPMPKAALTPLTSPGPLVLVPIAPAAPATRLVAFAKLSNFGATFHPLAGAGLGFSHDLGHFAVELGPSLAASSRRVPLGSVRALSAELSARLALRFPSRVLPAEVGAGFASGYARIAATSSSEQANARSLHGMWAGPFVFAALEAPFAEPAFLQFAAELGYVTLPVRGFVAESSDLEIAGVWSGLSIGLGLDL